MSFNCNNCGAPLKPGSKFCSKCGNVISQENNYNPSSNNGKIYNLDPNGLQNNKPPINNGQGYNNLPINNGQGYNNPPINNRQGYNTPPINNRQGYNTPPINNRQGYNTPPVNNGGGYNRNINNQVWNNPNNQQRYTGKKSTNKLVIILPVCVISVLLISAIAFFAIQASNKTEQDKFIEASKREINELKDEYSKNNDSGNSGGGEKSYIYSKEETSSAAETVTEPVTEPVPVPHRYEGVKLNCTWEEAKRFCEENGGHLATITSAEENAEVIRAAEQKGIKVAWIGGNNLSSSDRAYKWITGENFTYADWLPGEPNNDQGIEHYLVVLKSKGVWKWNDEANNISKDYSSILGYVCEWE